jgi:hypothetical protein
MAGEAPQILLRDRDDKFGASFNRVAEGVGIRVIKTAVRAPDMIAIAGRFVGSARREILDHVIVLDDQHLGRLVAQYKEYYHAERFRQGLGGQLIQRPIGPVNQNRSRGEVVCRSRLGGLPSFYVREAASAMATNSRTLRVDRGCDRRDPELQRDRQHRRQPCSSTAASPSCRSGESPGTITAHRPPRRHGLPRSRPAPRLPANTSHPRREPTAPRRSPAPVRARA